MNTTEQDIMLWESFCQGDQAAYGILFRKYYPALFQFGKKFVTDAELVEDCIQELFAALWLSRPPVPVHSVKAYLIKSVKYKILKALRRSGRRSSASIMDEIAFELSHDHFLIAQQEKAALVERIKSALEQLSSRQKEIIYLKYYQNLSYEEVSDIMNINYQVARNLLYQSIKSLKKILLHLLLC